MLLRTQQNHSLKKQQRINLKSKIKQVKPVLHDVLAEGGHIDVFEYSAEGTRQLSEQVENACNIYRESSLRLMLFMR
jgi:hypothetical protein